MAQILVTLAGVAVLAGGLYFIIKYIDQTRKAMIEEMEEFEFPEDVEILEEGVQASPDVEPQVDAEPIDAPAAKKQHRGRPKKKKD